MPITQNFSISQSPSLPNVISFVDTSTGSDVTIINRRIYLQKADGTYLTPTGSATSYINWIYSLSAIDLSVMDKDYALSIKIDWLDAGNNILYTKTSLFVFTAYNEAYYYGLGKLQLSNPALVSDKNYYNNKMKLRVALDSASQAMSFALDLINAQLNLDQATTLVINKIYYF